MFSRKKPDSSKRRTHDLSQFGLTDIPDEFDPSLGFGDDDDDSTLEAELAVIAGSGESPKPKAKPQLVPEFEIDKMISNCLNDDVGSEDDDIEDLEKDTELLGELREIVGGHMDKEREPSPEQLESGPDAKGELVLPTTGINIIGIITQRIELYKVAEANAKAAGKNAKIRQYNRGLKVLNELLQKANSGKVIKLEDIPPEVLIKAPEKTISVASEDTSAKSTEFPSSPTKEDISPELRINPGSQTISVASANNSEVAISAMSPSKPQDIDTKTEDSVPVKNMIPLNPLVEQMRSRQQEYKVAAIQSKRSGDTTMALQFLNVVKQFDVVIKMIESGQEVDLSDMPPPPDQFKDFIEKLQTGAIVTEPTPVIDPNPSPLSTTNMLEALQQRLDKYKSVEETAKSQGNARKARTFGRIVKQYEDAIKAYKAGRPVAYEELPIPPGFDPLHVESGTTQSPVTKSISNPFNPSDTSSVAMQDDSNSTKAVSPNPDCNSLTTRTSGNQQKNNLAEQQMKILLERQKEFKLAAIEAKKAGEIDQAKEYLRIYKGFDALLNAASSGLPVDLSTLPVPPSQRENLEDSFAIISTEECDPNSGISDIAVRIEEQLVKQLMMCKNTRDHHKAMGDIAGMNRFENLALTVQKDLDLVRYSKRKNFTLPKFHYEKRSFNIVHCNTDLTDNELEIIVVRGISYNVANPKDVDTYVKIEFPLPNDESVKMKTSLVKDTDSPDYNQHFKVDIVRSNRQFQRIFKRHGVKFEIYSRGGFLRSDILIGTATVKLQPLETKCDIHDTFDLLEGRKKVGGKLEIKIRVRNPILTKQMEHINEKWLVIDT